ncbi:uncharacterized protein A4U43_C03F810 [Asparagus officinalis]|uniref:Uncharacterized protein n=1 Tax=Asparagus officinalis TaxID=4686 RepID=A0A5P1F930_ASPOF|nr:myb-related protein 306-like isoform X2 [Asparagus officinalis]ONK73907.1 uncharacterized protein A4U43_C03F810 [Asparagus officinalis]
MAVGGLYLPKLLGLQRCGKSCRLRWTNYLRPDIKRGKFTLQEEQTIIQLHALLGNRWSAIATHLPKRTDNEIKNYWNTHLKKRLAKMGIDPVTHKPRSETSGLLTSNSDGDYSKKSSANLSHIAQWESARLEAEARLVRESKLRAPSALPVIYSPPHPQHQRNKSAAMATCLHDSQVTDMVTQQGEPCRSKSAGGCSLRLGGGGGHVDLQSPTSTLSFSDTSMVLPIISMGFAHQNSTTLLCHDQAHLGNSEGLEVEQHFEIKCFDKPLIRLVSDNKDHRHRTMGGAGTGGLLPPQVAAGLPYRDTSNIAFGAELSSWLIPGSTINCSTMRFSTGGDFGPPPPLLAASGGGLYTEMLLNSSHNAAGADNEEDSDLVDVDHGESCVEEEDDDDEDEDEGNNYWNNILDLVKLSPPSNSPPSPVF